MSPTTRVEKSASPTDDEAGEEAGEEEADDNDEEEEEEEADEEEEEEEEADEEEEEEEEEADEEEEDDEEEEEEADEDSGGLWNEWTMHRSALQAARTVLCHASTSAGEHTVLAFALPARPPLVSARSLVRIAVWITSASCRRSWRVTTKCSMISGSLRNGTAAGQPQHRWMTRTLKALRRHCRNTRLLSLLVVYMC